MSVFIIWCPRVVLPLMLCKGILLCGDHQGIHLKNTCLLLFFIHNQLKWLFSHKIIQLYPETTKVSRTLLLSFLWCSLTPHKSLLFSLNCILAVRWQGHWHTAFCNHSLASYIQMVLTYFIYLEVHQFLHSLD